jgi:hypothetical protein
MQINILATPYKYNKLLKKGFDQSLGYLFWNTAVMIAPIDTGNLRRSILLAKNNSRHIKISYDTFMANYIQFLEEGQGPVKKYKNFIKGDTAQAITEQLVAWIITGRRPLFSRQGVKPFVQLKESKRQPFSAERALLRQANMNTNVISAKARMQISKIREIAYYNERSKVSGNKPSVSNASGPKGINRNISHLGQIYKDRMADRTKNSLSNSYKTM